MADKARSPEQGLLFLLEHPLRKLLLRLYVDEKGPLSPKELAHYTKQNLSSVGYHVRALAKYGAVELVDTRTNRGAVEHFYRATPLVTETPWLLVILWLPLSPPEEDPNDLTEEERFRRLEETIEFVDSVRRRLVEEATASRRESEQKPTKKK